MVLVTILARNMRLNVLDQVLEIFGHGRALVTILVRLLVVTILAHAQDMLLKEFFQGLAMDTPSKGQSVDDIQAAPPLKNEISTLQKTRASRSPQDWTKYCEYRNFCTSQFRAAKSAYLHRKHEELASATDGSHRWWTLAKQLAKISTPHLAIPDLRADEDVATTDFEKTTLLAKFFASKCTSTAPPEHLKGAPFPLPEKQPIFDFLPILKSTVLRTLQHLPISKATAHPLITNRVLRECAPIVCPSITHLFNLSITTGVFLDAWKRATVTPNFKNQGTAGDPSNYRPVSLLPAMGKVLDRIQSSCLLQHLVQHNLISPHQFGFLPGKSTTMQLVYLSSTDGCQLWKKDTISQQSFWTSRRPLTAFGITDYCTAVDMRHFTQERHLDIQLLNKQTNLRQG